jgi:sugar phosphate permease
MNMCGNIGGAISPALLAYLVKDFGWDVPFFGTSAFCICGALIYSKIDASKRIVGL